MVLKLLSAELELNVCRHDTPTTLLSCSIVNNNIALLEQFWVTVLLIQDLLICVIVSRDLCNGVTVLRDLCFEICVIKL